MTPNSRRVAVAGPAGRIDCTVDGAPAPNAGIAIVAHPHPLFGGHRDNKVVQTLGRTLHALGYTVWLPDFRGVRESEGLHDDGQGEVDDLAAVLDQAQQDAASQAELPGQTVVLAGFSFGSMVVTRLATRLAAANRPAHRLILVGTATSKWTVDPVPGNTLVIHGENDEVVPLSTVLDWARPQELPVVVIPGADHFFHRKLTVIKRLVRQAWGQPEPSL
jgi:alpha/beta superfamily hydrolase